jgi:hypothetical protein
MLTFLFGAFYSELKVLRTHVDLLNSTKDRPDVLSSVYYEGIADWLGHFREECKKFELPESIKRIDRIIAHVKDKHDHVYLRVHLNDLEPAIKGEAEDHLVDGF